MLPVVRRPPGATPGGQTPRDSSRVLHRLAHETGQVPRTGPTPISSAPNPCSEMAARQAARRVADRSAGMARLGSLVCGRLSPASAYFPANAPTSGAIDSMAWLGSV